MAAHSKHSASSTKRWMNCPGSVKLCEFVPERTSPYAEEGTRAHDVANYILTGKKVPFDVDTEMLTAVKTYTDLVQQELSPGAEFWVEHRFDLSSVFPGMFGTSDCVIYYPEKKFLRVYDYKHGAGVAVEVDDNEQLKYYALGALSSLDLPCVSVELVIVQPRCPHADGPVRRYLFDAFDLLDFSAELKQAALRTQDEGAPLVPGDHCRFCPAAGICPKLHEVALVTAKEEFSPSFSYDPLKLSQVLSWLPVLEAWIKNVREFAYGEAQHGRTPPGWKLVEKRATRKWKDEGEVCLRAKACGTDEMFEMKLKTVAQAEKVLGKKEFHEQYSDLVVAESSGLTLAPASDKRPAALLDPKHEFTAIAADEN